MTFRIILGICILAFIIRGFIDTGSFKKAFSYLGLIALYTSPIRGGLLARALLEGELAIGHILGIILLIILRIICVVYIDK